MRSLPVAAVALGLPLLLLAALPAGAQQVNVERSFEVQLFSPAGPNGYLAVDGAGVPGARQFSIDLMANYQRRPFGVFLVQNDEIISERSDVVRNQVAADVTSMVGFGHGLALGLDVPVTLAMDGDGLDPATGQPQQGGLSTSGVGDLRLRGKWRVWADPRRGTALAFAPEVTLPTGDQSEFLGEASVTARPRAVGEWHHGPFAMAANLGAVLRERSQTYSSIVGQQLTYGLAVAWRASERFTLLGELNGRNGFTRQVDENPVELDAGVRARVTRTLYLQAGAGAGLISGVGSPDVRALGGLSWQPDYGDDDHDGVNNMDDGCLDKAEDRDGFQDEDGCPEPDNDGDYIPDVRDRCPLEPEDQDGFQDGDGCIDPDNDGDGLTDTRDGCPNMREDGQGAAPKDGCPISALDTDHDGVRDNVDQCVNEQEDQDGFHDEDGCPDPDNDDDGAPDGYDNCPLEAEDQDGFQDEDGCPELDNDGDALPDAQDKCPDKPETINGKEDGDGCPDAGEGAVSLAGEKLVLAQPVAFKPKKAELLDGGKGVLDQLALTMRTLPWATGFKIVVAAEPQRNEPDTQRLSTERAAAIKAHLVARGIPAEKLDVVGVVFDHAAVAVQVQGQPKAPPTPAD